MFGQAFDPDAGGGRPIDEIAELEHRLPSVTESELATMLAALRQFQRDGWLEEELRRAYFGPNATPLSTAEVDDLCLRLNTGA